MRINLKVFQALADHGASKESSAIWRFMMASLGGSYPSDTLMDTCHGEYVHMEYITLVGLQRYVERLENDSIALVCVYQIGRKRLAHLCRIVERAAALAH